MANEIAEESVPEVEISPEIAPETVENTPPADVPAPEASDEEGDAEPSKKGKKAAKTAEISPSYQPNYKYKVGEKELEFDEWIKAAIKTKEQEDKMRDYYTRAMGIDDVKADRERIKGEAKTYTEKYSTLEKAVQETLKPLKNGDLGSFFNGLNIPKEQVMKYVLDLLNEQEMPPEQRAQLEAQRQAQARASSLEENYNGLLNKHQDLEARLLSNELDSELNKPDVTEIAQIYEQRMGQPFRNAVVQQGELIFKTTGRSLSPREVISEFAAALGKLMGPTAPNVGGQVSIQQQAQQVMQKPTLPNIQGRATSPAKGTVRSLDDIRKIAAEKYGF